MAVKHEKGEYVFLVPAYKEDYHHIKLTLKSLLSQTLRPERIVIIVEEEDKQTRDVAESLSRESDVIDVAVKPGGRSSKAAALNYAIDLYDPPYIVADVNSVFPKNYAEHVLQYKGKYTAVTPFVRRTKKDPAVQKKVWRELQEFLYLRTGNVHLSGEGLALFEKIKIPETLAEDFALAIELCNRGKRSYYTEIEVYEANPPSLMVEMKRRGRWYKGMVESLKLAKTKCCREGFKQYLALVTIGLLVSGSFSIAFPFVPVISPSDMEALKSFLGMIYSPAVKDWYKTERK